MSGRVQGACTANRGRIRFGRGLVGCLLVSLLCHGCGVAIRCGRLPDLTPLESRLEQGVSTRGDVLAALGEPRGRGQVLFPVHDGPRDVWYYYYEEATLNDSQRIFLYVLFSDDLYDGYLWFSSIPGTRPSVPPAGDDPADAELNEIN